MGKYIAKRLLIMIPTLVFIVFVIFCILSCIPNSPGRIILGMNVAEEEVIALNEKLGYYDPLPVKFFKYLTDALQGNFGDSYKYGKPVFQLLMPKFPTTAKLAFLSMMVSALIGIPVGIISALKKHSLADRASTVLALLLGSVPGFVLGVLMILPISFQQAIIFAVFLLILQQIMGLAGAESFTVSECDILHGIILDTL